MEQPNTGNDNLNFVLLGIGLGTGGLSSMVTDVDLKDLYMLMGAISFALSIIFTGLNIYKKHIKK